MTTTHVRLAPDARECPYCKEFTLTDTSDNLFLPFWECLNPECAEYAGKKEEPAPKPKLRKDDLAYLLGPIVYHPGGWDVGPILPELIPKARQELVASGEREMATLEETLAYLSSASYEAPLLREDANVMFWLTCEVWEKHGLNKDDEPVWKKIGLSVQPELTEFEVSYHLNALRRKIRKSVTRHGKLKIKKLEASEI
jgi:hypothetical protein